MTLIEYFEGRSGTGILSTADASGEVDAAIYARPHFLRSDDQTLTFIMGDHQSHSNLQSNPKACYLFIEAGPGYKGKRLYLTKISEESSAEKIQEVRRESTPRACSCDEDAKRFLVHFKVEQERPLVGDCPKGD